MDSFRYYFRNVLGMFAFNGPLILSDKMMDYASLPEEF